MISDLELLDAYNIMVKAHNLAQHSSFSGSMPSITRGACLGILLQNGPLIQCELAKQLYVSPAAVSTLLKRMEQDGLITRYLAPGNAKEMVASLTDVGYKYAQRLEESATNAAADFFCDLTETERESAYHIFQRLTERAKKQIK